VSKLKKSYIKYDQSKDELDFDFSYNDEETNQLHEKLNGSITISEDDLRRISLWKSNRILSVTGETLQKLNNLSENKNISLRDPLVKEVIDGLVLSQGIGFPMASAILKFINPNVFPIIDVRAYRALTGNKPYYGTYTYDKYIEYSEILTSISKSTNKQLREIDEQLYCFDKKHNGAI
jgi:thermostable 8-oxoguanine DNA glycosylase